MPRELLLPIPHAIADKVHHALLHAAEDAFEAATEKRGDPATYRSLLETADKLDTLAREAGVIGW